MWSLPMRADSTVIGTLNFYRLSGAVLDEPIDTVQVLADVVAAMLVTDPPVGSQYAVADRWAGRAVVHQAVGILMAQLHLGPDDAMAMLRACARVTGGRAARSGRPGRHRRGHGPIRLYTPSRAATSTGGQAKLSEPVPRLT